MQSARITARFGFAAVQTDARIHWRLHGPPAFDARASAGPFTTLVAYLPRPFAARLVDTVGALPALSEHYRYSPTQLHVTIRNLDGADLARLPALLAGQQPIRLETNGLGCTRETLLLGLLTTDPASRHLREQLDRLPGMQPGRRPLRELAFANVLRLNGPVAPELYRSIRHVRNTLAGEPLELGELTLVRTDKVGSPDRTEIIGRYLLSPRDPNTGNDAPAARRWT